MSYIKLLSVTAGILLMGGCASNPSNSSHDSPDGTWSTKIQTQGGAWLSHGKMIFSGSDKATYSFHGGRILFNEVDDAGNWKGHWVENTWGSVRCQEERDGSKTWGEAIFRFNETFTRFDGTWDRCGDGRRNPWVGNRT